MAIHDENGSTSNESDPTVAGRWIQDPDDPEFEVWEPATVETAGVDKGEDERPVVVATRGFDANRKPKEVVWSDGRRPNPDRVCTARRTNGEPCRRTAIAGGNVCPAHGGLAPHIKAKARARLEQASDRMAKNLLKMAVDDDVADGVRLAATNSALDRAGLSAKTAVEVEVGPSKGFEQILGAVLQGGSRAASRAARGEPDNDGPDDDWAASEVLDAQVVDYEALPPAPRPTQTEHPASAPRGSAQRSVSAQSPAQSSGSGFMDLEDALDTLHRTAPPPAAPAPRRHSR